MRNSGKKYYEEEKKPDRNEREEEWIKMNECLIKDRKQIQGQGCTSLRNAKGIFFHCSNVRLPSEFARAC